MKVWISLS